MDESSKLYLHAGLCNDTRFLSSLELMDYSLLVGVDLQRSQLVVGVIDYVRLYTWDKHAESLMKGVARKDRPTITRPDEYAARFFGALRDYFTVVPNAHSSVVASFTTE